MRVSGEESAYVAPRSESLSEVPYPTRRHAPTHPLPPADAGAPRAVGATPEAAAAGGGDGAAGVVASSTAAGMPPVRRCPPLPRGRGAGGGGVGTSAADAAPSLPVDGDLDAAGRPRLAGFRTGAGTGSLPSGPSPSTSPPSPSSGGKPSVELRLLVDASLPPVPLDSRHAALDNAAEEMAEKVRRAAPADDVAAGGLPRPGLTAPVAPPIASCCSGCA